MGIPISYNLRNLTVRKTTTLMTALGVALTVAVLLGIGTLVQGLRGSLSASGHPLHMIVMRQGATAELVSLVSKEKFDTLKFSPGIAQLNGEPMISHEVISVISLTLRSDTSSVSNVNVRGVSPIGIQMREEMELLEGRWFTPGKREVVVGTGIHSIRDGTSVGDSMFFGRGDWEVVGVFKAGKSAFNSEIWADGNLATADLGRGTTRSSILIRAESESELESLKTFINDDQRIQLESEMEREYYSKQMSSAEPIRYLGIFVAIVMAVGSCFAAMNTMFAAIANRSKEIGVLRLLGFSQGSILISFLFESLVLSLFGGLLGCLLVLPMNGLEGRIGNFVTFSETTFEFELTLAAAGIGLMFSAVMGVFGGIAPAYVAAKRQIRESMAD